jgi:hypothetical protein
VVKIMNENKGTKKSNLLTEIEVADILRITPQTLRVRRMKKQPPRFLKIGRRVFYEEQDIMDFKESCYREPITDNNKEK